MNKAGIQRLVSILILSTALMGCQKMNSTWKGLKEGLSDFIHSVRPQNTTHVIINLKLQSQPLSQRIQAKDGKRFVSQMDIDTLKIEHDEMLKKLQALSPEIKVIYDYKYVINAMSVVVPVGLADQVQALSGVAGSQQNENFSRPSVFVNADGSKKFTDLDKDNSVKFIKAVEASQKYNIKGQNIRVGVLDTGIDYTHKMLGGNGDATVFESLDPNTANNFFPNQKVVGGIDLVGTEFNSASEDFALTIPKQDANPIDEGGHGSHVAGTIAGLKINDQSYDGVAPEASLYAIKVFGAEGSTGDNVVIAGFEYAMDPNGDGDLSDQLQVLNMSLGSSYGTPHMLYTEAIQNLTEAGVVVVASAGNSGHEDYIVGSPSTADDALSVAASRDNSYHIWHFDAVVFDSALHPHVVAESVEAAISTPISQFTELKGKLVYIGLGDKELTEEQKAQLAGNVALIDRGAVSFSVKLQTAFSGNAKAVVVVNNKPDDPFAMGGTDKIDIPAVMVAQAVGDLIKEDMKSGDVTVDFKAPDKIAKPQLIDTLTGFTSKGPRSVDSFLKPEISAPGDSVVSAAMGKGEETVGMSGTSMAAPHMAGVMALLVQKFPALNPRELKSLVMQTSEMIFDPNKKRYLVTEQGAGRVNVLKATDAKAFAQPGGISLGMLNLIKKKTLVKNIELHNISDEKLNLKAEWFGHEAMTLQSLNIELNPHEKKSVDLYFTISMDKMTATSEEIDGWVKFVQGEEAIFHIPALAVVNQISSISVETAKTLASEIDEATGSLTRLDLKNTSSHDGEALVFNLLAQGERKKQNSLNPFVSTHCDLQAVGYRTVTRVEEGSAPRTLLQVGFKTYDVNNHWHTCEVAVLIDTNMDNVPDQELVGTIQNNLPGVSVSIPVPVSYLLDSVKARQLRKEFEIKMADKTLKEMPVDYYKPAVIGSEQFVTYNNSTVAVIEADVNLLKLRDDGQLALKALTMASDPENVQYDDFAIESLNSWQTISVVPELQSYHGMKESYIVSAKQNSLIELTKGSGLNDLLVLFPTNKFELSPVMQNSQMSLIKPSFEE